MNSQSQLSLRPSQNGTVNDSSQRMRFNARYALVTYTHADTLDPSDIGAHIGTLDAQCVIGRENHADGSLHFHCFVDFGRKFSTRNCRFLDVHGFHPNIKPGYRTPEKGWDYATKDGDVAWCSDDFVRPGSGRGGGTHEKWATIVGCDTRQGFIEAITKLDPKSLVCSFAQVTKYADWKYAKSTPEYTTPESLTIDDSRFPSLQGWVLGSLQGWEQGIR